MFYPHRTNRGPSYSLSSLSAALHTHVESPPPRPPSTFESKCQGRSFVGCYTYAFVRKLDCTFVHTCTSDVAFYAEFSIEKHLGDVLVIITYTQSVLKINLGKRWKKSFNFLILLVRSFQTGDAKAHSMPRINLSSINWVARHMYCTSVTFKRTEPPLMAAEDDLIKQCLAVEKKSLQYKSSYAADGKNTVPWMFNMKL